MFLNPKMRSLRNYALAKYEFAKFNGRRYDLSNINAKLLAEPPVTLNQHVYKDEIINFVLDKAFVELPLKPEYV